MNKLSEISLKIIKSNNIKEENIPNFVKELKTCLRLDYNIKTTSKDFNFIIEKWYEINSLPENRIGGSINE